jgi:hypothetical protein
MSIANLLVPNNLTIYCNILNANILNVLTLTVTNLNVTNLTTQNNTFLSQSATQLNPSVFIGSPATSTIVIAQASGSGSFFSDAVVGDLCIRDSGANIRMGILGVGTSTMNMNGTQLNVNTNTKLAANSTIPTVTIGSTSNDVIGVATSAGNFFTNSTPGDFCMINQSASNNLLLGVGDGTTASQLSLTQTDANFSVGVSFPTIGGTPDFLDYYETFQLLTGQYSGPWTASLSVGLEFTRIGNVVTLSQLSDVLSSSGSGTPSIITYSGATIPTRFLPVQAIVRLPVVIINNGVSISGASTAQGSGFVSLTNTGNLTVAVSSTTGLASSTFFTSPSGGNSSGVYSFTVCYHNN